MCSFNNLQCTKHINSASGQPSPVSFRSLCENPTRKLGKTGNISHFHFFGGNVAVLFQILVQQFFFELRFKQVLLSFQSLHSINTQLGPLDWPLQALECVRKGFGPYCFNFQTELFSKTIIIKNLTSTLCSTFKHNPFALVYT